MIRAEDTMSAWPYTYLRDILSIQVLGWLREWNARLPTRMCTREILDYQTVFF